MSITNTDMLLSIHFCILLMSFFLTFSKCPAPYMARFGLFEDRCSICCPSLRLLYSDHEAVLYDRNEFSCHVFSGQCVSVGDQDARKGFIVKKLG